jgi:hypothetical protein
MEELKKKTQKLGNKRTSTKEKFGRQPIWFEVRPNTHSNRLTWKDATEPTLRYDPGVFMAKRKKVTKILYQWNQPTADSRFADTTKIVKVCWPPHLQVREKMRCNFTLWGAYSQFFASMIWFRSDFVQSSCRYAFGNSCGRVINECKLVRV